MRKFAYSLLAFGILAAPSLALAADGDAGDSDGALFKMLDKNGDGQIRTDEVPDDKRRLFERLIDKADEDKNGAISAAELAAGLKESKPERPLQHREEGGPGLPADFSPERMLSRLDANGDGKVTLDEVPEERREGFGRMLQKFDTNGDESLNKDEMAAFAKTLGGFGGSPQGKPGEGRPGGKGGFRPDPEQFFSKIDSNGDGKFTKDEAGDRSFMLRTIERFDSNGDGALSKDEFKAAGEKMRAIGGGGKGPGSAEKGPGRGGMPEAMFGRLDANGDGKVTADEVPEPARERVKKMIEQADDDKDGAVTKDEFRKMLEKRGGERFGRRGDQAGSKNEPARGDGAAMTGRAPLFRALDADHDGSLSPSELEAAPSALRKLDANGDGKIDPQDMAALNADGAASRGERGRGERGRGERSRGERGRGERAEHRKAPDDKKASDAPSGDSATPTNPSEEKLPAEKLSDEKASVEKVSFAKQSTDERPDDKAAEADREVADRKVAEPKSPADGNDKQSQKAARAAKKAKKLGKDAGIKTKPEVDAFQKLDVNGDGKVTEDEFLAGGKKKFLKLDVNGDSALDKTELNHHGNKKPNKPKKKKS